MSRINDALNEARREPPRTPQNSLPPLPPIPPEEPTPILTWLIPALVILFIVAAIFFIGWSSANRTVTSALTNDSAVVSATQTVAVAAPPTNSPAETIMPIPFDAPVLQGIFYSPTAPTAIINGKTVSVGDHYEQYRVQEITKYTVTLVDANGKPIKIGMGN